MKKIRNVKLRELLVSMFTYFSLPFDGLCLVTYPVTHKLLLLLLLLLLELRVVIKEGDMSS